MKKENQLERILPLVRKPGRYIGGERHATEKGFYAENINFCLIFPDLYELGMSHQGLQILYHILNEQDGVAAHRCYTPDIDMENMLRAQGEPLFSLETQTALGDYDVLGFTLPYELCYTNILTVLDLAGIPFLHADRNKEEAAYPLLIAGGACAMNPEPVADFFDAIVLGDGEEIIVEVARTLEQAKEQNFTRKETIAALGQLEGIYIPSWYTPRYEGDQLVEVEKREGISPEITVKRRVLAKLIEPEILSKPLVPIVKPVHDRLGLEIARGCTRGCRFCQAGMLYRPVRERSVEEIMTLAEEGITSSGFDELALLSLSTGDYSCLSPLISQLMARFSQDKVSLSMPSMRVGTLTPEIMQEIKRVRKTGFTIAPEAGTHRLRQVINKGITEEDLLQTCEDAFSLGWNLIKLYFMIGLPTESDEDVQGIVDLSLKARAAAACGKQGKAQVTVSVGTFVPKPHTPFQWQAQLSLEDSLARLVWLKESMPKKGLKLKWNDVKSSFLEGVFSRGDRRLAELIQTAWHRGARLDGWSEHFDLGWWQDAAQEIGMNMKQYLRERSPEEVLPWDHISCGIDKAFMMEEYSKALQETYTPDCRNHGCQGCGLCDFKAIAPVVHGKVSEPPTSAPQAEPSIENSQQSITEPVQDAVKKKNSGDTGQRPVFAYRVHYARQGQSRLYGHLEILQLVFRALQRAGLPLLFSHGFNPSPKVSFSQALPVGVESLVEYFDMELAEPVHSLEATKALLGEQLAPVLTVTSVEWRPKHTPSSVVTEYEFISALFTDTLKEKADAFLAVSSYMVERIRKRKRKNIDIRPLVESITFQPGLVHVALISHQSQAATNPREIMEQVLGLSPRESMQVGVRKVNVRDFSSSS